MKRLLAIGLLCLGLAGCKKCVRGHTERVHHPEWVQMMPMQVGKVTTMIPLFHPAYDSDDFVCDFYQDAP